jgi:hypothetical protein
MLEGNRRSRRRIVYLAGAGLFLANVRRFRLGVREHARVVGALPALFSWLGKRRSERRFEEACDWRDKHRAGELSDSDLRAWRRWSAVPENKDEYHRLIELGAQLRQLSRPTLEQ